MSIKTRYIDGKNLTYLNHILKNAGYSKAREGFAANIAQNIAGADAREQQNVMALIGAAIDTPVLDYEGIPVAVPR